MADQLMNTCISIVFKNNATPQQPGLHFIMFGKENWVSAGSLSGTALSTLVSMECNDIIKRLVGGPLTLTHGPGNPIPHPVPYV